MEVVRFVLAGYLILFQDLRLMYNDLVEATRSVSVSVFFLLELIAAVGTLFNPVARVEAVQAMMLLAAFGENGWLPGG